MSKRQENPIIEIYRGVSIRKNPTVTFRVSQEEMKRLVDLKIDHKVATRTVFKLILCQECRGINVTVYNKERDLITIQNPFHATQH